MAGADDTASGNTLADRPGARQIDPAPGAAGAHGTSPDAPETIAEATDPLSPHDPTVQVAGPPTELDAGAYGSARHGTGTGLTSAADAMHDEEIDRTRLFIRMGWAISAATIVSVPLLHAGRVMSIVFVAAMLLGIVVSAWYHHAFANPQHYTGEALARLALVCVFNAHVAVLYYGAFTVAPLIVVIGIHFVARTEAERAARWIIAFAVALYTIIALAIISGAIADPGVFASDRHASSGAQTVGAVFVLSIYVLAYVTARSFRQASLRAIDSLQRTTRLASQREALMEELRLDLERALRVGGPGRYTEQIVGSYRLGAVIGRGAMGEVYDAMHVATGEPAAVKLVRRELLSDPVHVARFMRESRATATLDSPHVARLLEAGAGDPPFLAMERLRGETLAEQLRRDGKLDPGAIADLVRQVGAGLDTASLAGVVHRDIKPQNLLFDAGRAWKILDFGIAMLAEDGSSTLTHGGIVGTPSYMAPEQAQGKRLDGRADLYALAAVAYRCITGRHPFSGTDTPSLLYAVIHRMPQRPGEATELHADADRWFALALAKSPADRFATGAELSEALDAALTGSLDPRLRKRADALVRKLDWA